MLYIRLQVRLITDSMDLGIGSNIQFLGHEWNIVVLFLGFQSENVRALRGYTNGKHSTPYFADFLPDGVGNFCHGLRA